MSSLYTDLSDVAPLKQPQNECFQSLNSRSQERKWIDQFSQVPNIDPVAGGLGTGLGKKIGQESFVHEVIFWLK